MNIGIFLGTFNPPHIGHLNCLQRALDTKIIDRIVVVPAFKNPWKVKPSEVFDPNNHEGMSLDEEFHLRSSLCKEMFKDLISKNKVYVSDIEYSIWRKTHKYEEDCVYSYETLSHLKNFPNEYLRYWKGVGKPTSEQSIEGVKFILITTVETLSTIPNWKNGEWILKSMPIMALTSKHLESIVAPSDDIDHLVEGIPVIKIADEVSIHSTKLREMFLEGKSLLPLVNTETFTAMDNECIRLSMLYKKIAEAKKDNI